MCNNNIVLYSVLSKHSGGSDPLLTVSTSIDRSDMIGTDTIRSLIMINMIYFS